MVYGRQIEFAASKTFANEALYPVAVDGTRDKALADDDAQARSRRVGSPEQLKMSTCFDGPRAQNLRKFCCKLQPLRTPETEPGGGSLVHTLKL